MRLIASSSTFPNPDEPNKGIYVYRKIWHLAQMSDVVAVAPIPYFPRTIPSTRYARYARVPARAVLDGLEVHYPRVLVTPRIGRSLYGFFYAACLLRPMARLVKEHRPEALLTFWAYPDGFATVLLSRVFKLPVFVSAGGCDVNNLDAHLGKRRMVEWAFRHCDGAVAVSRALGSRIVDLGVDPARVKVVPNGLDEAYQVQLARGFDVDSDRRTGTTVLFCGRLSEEKDPLSLMEAFRLLLVNRPDARLMLVGDGPLRPRIEQLAAAWNIADRVALAGEVQHDQVARHMRQADVFCLSSVREGYPNVLLEALACGLPIVATNVGGVPEIVANENLGTLVPSGQPAELARALETALNRRWDRQILKDAVRGRSWHDVASEILSFMEHTIR
jgi:glycosyltransferase involved in cell wall biosynthesis